MSHNQKVKKSEVLFKEQFTARGMIIGALGAAILTTSSMYVALKLGALPWPIIFVALVSMFSLKTLGKSNINEIQRSTTKVSRSDRSGTARVANRRCTRAAGSRPQGNVTQVKVRKTRVIMSKIRGSIRFSSDFC